MHFHYIEEATVRKFTAYFKRFKLKSYLVMEPSVGARGALPHQFV